MSIKLKGSSDGSVSFDAPADTSPSGSDITLTLPTSAGSANQFLKNSGIAGELEYSSMVEDSSGNLGLGGVTSPTWASDGGIHLGDDYGIGFGDGGSGRPDFQLITAGDGRLDLRCGFGSDDADVGIESTGQIQIGNNLAKTNVASTVAALVQTRFAGSFTNYSAIRESGPATFCFGRVNGSGSQVLNTGNEIGAIRWAGADGTDLETQAATISCFVDASPGSNDMPGRLVFSTTADGGSSPQERMRINKDGKLFVKNSFSDSARNTVIQIECSGQGRGKILSGNSDTDPATLGASSDRRLKTNIRNYTGGLERIRQIPVKIYDEVNTSATGVISWVADEVAPIFPEAVIGEANAVDADGNPEYQILSSLKFFPDLIQCVQTLIAKVETLETQNTAQQAQIDDLLARVTALEAA